jgi:hypothetical protein
MMRSLRKSLRQVLPPSVYVILAAIALVGIETTWLIVERFGGYGPPGDNVLMVRDNIVVSLLAMYGIYRVVAFHPLGRPDYRDWLKRTPWTRGLPLPVGPVHPTWADVVVVGAVAALLADPRIPLDPEMRRPSVMGAILTCVLVHATSLTVFIWLTQPRRLAYVASFLLGLTLQLGAWAPLGALAALIAGWSVALVGLSRSWELFPWDETVDWGAGIKRRWQSAQTRSGGMVDDGLSPDRVPPSELGWPFGSLSPWVPPATIDTAERMLIAALLGWWMHAFLFQIHNYELLSGIGVLMVGYGTLFLAIARLGLNGGNHASPIGILGRLLTLRWIIPAYDQILVPPLSIVAMAAAMVLPGHFWLQIPLHTLVPLVTVCAIWCFILVGPSPTRWKLTAPARIVPGRLNKRNYDQLT